MVVWEDRGVLKPPKPPTVHATELESGFRELLQSRAGSIKQLEVLNQQWAPRHPFVIAIIYNRIYNRVGKDFSYTTEFLSQLIIVLQSIIVL